LPIKDEQNLSKMKFLVTGQNGQLGQEFCKYFSQHKLNYAAFSRDELDITNFPPAG